MKGRKQSDRLAARIRSYEESVNRLKDRASGYKKPGSRKKPR